MKPKKHQTKYITLKEFLRYQDKQTKTYVDLKIEALKEAHEAAQKIIDGKLHSSNQFKETVVEQSATFLKKTEFEILHKRVTDDLQILNLAKANMDGKASSWSVIGAYALAITGLLISLIKLFIN